LGAPGAEAAAGQPGRHPESQIAFR